MKKKILIVEDDQVFGKSIMRLLKLEDFLINIVTDGIAAKESLIDEEYDLILTDIKIPKLNGIELLHYINRSCKTPVILMSGFSDIIDIKEAIEIGAENFLPKPFSKQNLIEAVSNALNDNTSEKNDAETFLDFSKIDIENFVLGSQFNFPIYLKLNKSKFIKIAHKGEDIIYPQIQRFIQQGISSLYLESKDFIEFINNTNDLKNIILKNDKISNSKKLKFTKKVLDIVSQYEYQNMFSRELFNYSYETLENIIVLLTSSSATYRLLDLLSTKFPSLYSHSVATSLVSIALCKQNGWHKQSTILSISTAALFHDLGKKDWSEDFLSTPLRLMTDEQLEKYKKHPEVGAKILEENNIDNQVTLQIILQHHEFCDGTGFPESLTKNHIFPPSRLVCLADEFTKQLHGYPNKEKSSSVTAIIQNIKSQRGLYDEEQIKHLEDILNQ